MEHVLFVMITSLESWCEVIGTIKKVTETDGMIIVAMEDIGEIVLTLNDKPLMVRLKNLRGKQVAILHTDIPQYEYLVVEMPEVNLDE